LVLSLWVIAVVSAWIIGACIGGWVLCRAAAIGDRQQALRDLDRQLANVLLAAPVPEVVRDTRERRATRGA
jgi:hypothetical protein